LQVTDASYLNGCDGMQTGAQQCRHWAGPNPVFAGSCTPLPQGALHRFSTHHNPTAHNVAGKEHPASQLTGQWHDSAWLVGCCTQCTQADRESDKASMGCKQNIVLQCSCLQPCLQLLVLQNASQGKPRSGTDIVHSQHNGYSQTDNKQGRVWHTTQCQCLALLSL
jgi:hypothetical protein